MEIRTAYGEHYPVRIDCGLISRTKQAHKEECDINNIMAKYIKTGLIEHAKKHQGEYGFATSTDFKESIDIINKAQKMFDELPAKARKKFENDPAEFLDFVQDPENEDQLYDLGLSLFPSEGEIRETQPESTTVETPEVTAPE